MIKLLNFIILLCHVFYLYDCGTLPSSQIDEQTLITALLNKYNKTIRPDTVVSVDITTALQQIVSLDEKLQIMTSSSFISQSWFDFRLSWTPSASNNINVVMLPVKSLWIPDTMVLNSADSSGYLTVSDYSLASVAYTGQVYMILPALTIRTRCNLLVLSFPFDQQICSINLTSWAQGSNRIIYTENDSLVIDISQYIEHPIWKLKGVDMVVTKAEDRAPFEETYNGIISIQLSLRRKPLFYIMNGIFTCLILNCVTLLSYALPFGSQIGLCMTCFMTYSVNSLSFSNLFPQQSQYLMMITLYFILSMCWTLISMVWFVICNHFISKAEMPKLLYDFCGFLEKVFCCCFPRPKKQDVNSELATSGDIGTTNSEKQKCITCQKLFAVCFRKHNRIINGDKQQDMNSDKVNSPNDKPIETNEKIKSKCDFCNRCESCQADFDKDKGKGKNKKDIEAKCSALNYFIFIFVFLFMFIANMALWLLMSA